MIITHNFIIVLDEPTQPRKGRRRNSTFRQKSKGEAERMPLDLEAETPKTRALKQAERRRKGFRAAAMILICASVLALGRAAINETLLQNPRFTLQEIHVETSGMLSVNQVQNACGVAKGTNLLTVNLCDVRERLLQLPAVSSASVQRDFSGRLSLTVHQRQPVAWIKCEPLGWNPKHPGHCLVVDADGIAIPADLMVSDLSSLPVIDDKTIDQVSAGRAIASPRFIASLKLLKALHSREQRDSVKAISISVPSKFGLDAAFDNGTTVTFAYDDLDQQLQRYDRFITESRQKKWNVQSVNLVAMHNVPVSFRTTKSATTSMPEAIPVSAPASAQPKAASAPSSASKTATRGSSGKTTRTKSSSH